MYQAHTPLPQALPLPSAADVVLRPVGREYWAYCHELARVNMSPYLQRRGLAWNSLAWHAKAAISTFFLIKSQGQILGFASVRDDLDNNALHLGDLQIEAWARGQGIGTRCLDRIAELASQRGFRALKLHVFADNPAQRLYRRHGFRIIDRSFDKLCMLRECDSP